MLNKTLDLGESTAIALVLEFPEATVILDDLKARKAAIGLGLKVTGTIGVIVKAKIRGIIPSAKVILDKIQDTDFRIHTSIIDEAIRQAGE